MPGLLQLVAGIVDFQRRSVFGAVVFTSYAVLWFGIGHSWYLQLTLEDLPTPASQYLGVVLVVYLVFSVRAFSLLPSDRGREGG